MSQKILYWGLLVRGPLLFIIFMADLPTHLNMFLTVFPDGTSAFSITLSPGRHVPHFSHFYQLFLAEAIVSYFFRDLITFLTFFTIFQYFRRKWKLVERLSNKMNFRIKKFCLRRITWYTFIHRALKKLCELQINIRIPNSHKR